MSIKSLLKRSKLTAGAARWLLRSSFPLLAGFQRACHALFGVTPGTVYFSSFNGTLYNDNPRAVAEALHALRPEARIRFRLDRRGMADPRVPDYVEKVPAFSPRALKAMATSRVLVKNAGMRHWMRKFPDQYYVQLWHGDRGFKKIRLDNRDSAFERREAGWIDLMASGSDFGTRVDRSAFRFGGEILEVGCPRNDVLLDPPPGLAEQVRREAGIPEDVRVLLYAPTFRNRLSGGRQKAGVDLERARACLERATGERWICVTRGHELTRGMTSNAAMDLSAWPETSELLLIADMMITDYSSIGGDLMLLGRPVIYFQPDRGDYSAERGLYFDPDGSPLIVAHDEAELMDLLSKPIDGPANCRAVLEFFGARETGRAAQAVAERVARVLDGDK